MSSPDTKQIDIRDKIVALIESKFSMFRIYIDQELDPLRKAVGIKPLKVDRDKNE